MGKVKRGELTFDSELEADYYEYLAENKVVFFYQTTFKKNPMPINLGGRKNYTPDFLVIDNEAQTITIIELKGYSKWQGHIDDAIMNFVKNKVAYEQVWLQNWLSTIVAIKTLGYDEYEVKYQRLKHLKAHGFVDYNFKPKSLATTRKEKILELENELKEIKSELKKYKRYFEYVQKPKLTKTQLEFVRNLEEEYNNGKDIE